MYACSAFLPEGCGAAFCNRLDAQDTPSSKRDLLGVAFDTQFELCGVAALGNRLDARDAPARTRDLLGFPLDPLLAGLKPLCGGTAGAGTCGWGSQADAVTGLTICPSESFILKDIFSGLDLLAVEVTILLLPSPVVVELACLGEHSLSG